MQENMLYLIVIGSVVVGIAALAALVNYVISIVRGIQEMRHADNPPRNPPLPEELAKYYATKNEFAELRREIKEERERVDGLFDKQFDLIRGLTAETNEKFRLLEEAIKTRLKGVDNWQLGIERLIGRIEGKVENK